MILLSWKVQAAMVASCCLFAVAASSVGLAPQGHAQPPATGATQRPAATTSDAATAGRIPAPVVDVHDLMNLFNKPLFMHLKSAMAQRPSDDAGWKTIQERGYQAAEVANLVAMRPAGPQQQWLQASANLQAAGIALAQAAEAQNWQSSVKAYEGVIQRCNACHQARAPGEAPVLEP